MLEISSGYFLGEAMTEGCEGAFEGPDCVVLLLLDLDGGCIDFLTL